MRSASAPRTPVPASRPAASISTMMRRVAPAAVGDALREAADDARLADAGGPDEARAVAVALGEDVERAVDLGLAPEHRIELSRARPRRSGCGRSRSSVGNRFGSSSKRSCVCAPAETTRAPELCVPCAPAGGPPGLGRASPPGPGARRWRLARGPAAGAGAVRALVGDAAWGASALVAVGGRESCVAGARRRGPTIPIASCIAAVRSLVTSEPHWVMAR